MFEKIIEKIKEYDTVIIHRHKKPDGDAIGSQIGLKNIIRENFPGKRVYAVGDGAGRYSFMLDEPLDEIDDGVYENALAIVLDTSASALISDERYRMAKENVRIDHHIFCESICKYEVSNTSYESCCGLITELALECGLKINGKAATALYTGLVTDSGRFRYDSTTSNTFRLASALMKCKIDTNEIYKNLYADDFEKLKLRAEFTLKIRFTEKNTAYIYTSEEELAAYNTDPFSISRGMVGVMGDIKGVDVWVNFTENEGSVLCEIRSNRYNVNPIATKYGGGGHAKASGATLKSKEEAFALLSDLDGLVEV